ncbi:L,D-transpeptidase catalytic domain [Rubritalea squalenifaciens DSM 18772]|uniref:L,D-transpeptidase catalytic domain n=1 Tax=Rubritalea squalenifaciens DSM 18772 TaxID=1123071 RepID=A0A1M6SI83_9BACT|nr:murein L,D-transpeptidase family protein [Rubritalea squalenifaciens]SHK44329.1 L,D-transpeptidase catalytic domain [Rubritalea squalenifaciens DSM 18772]
MLLRLPSHILRLTAALVAGLGLAYFSSTVVECSTAKPPTGAEHVEFPPQMPAPEITLSPSQYAHGPTRARDAADRVTSRLNQKLREKGLTLGSPVFLRVFKQSHEMEVWLQDGESYKHFKTYRIAAMSGKLGPKQKEGDHQAPEGFYFVSPRQMNPQSRFHLSFNLGYPNPYDRAHGRTGSALMVHGNRVSIGCFAMTDYYIEEIYTLCDAALDKGQPFFRVHSFPFRLTEDNLALYKDNKWHAFWQNLKPGYDHFEQTRIPPNIEVREKEYVVAE